MYCCPCDHKFENPFNLIPTLINGKFSLVPQEYEGNFSLIPQEFSSNFSLIPPTYNNNFSLYPTSFLKYLCLPGPLPPPFVFTDNDFILTDENGNFFTL
jgi:hypothetical protein